MFEQHQNVFDLTDSNTHPQPANVTLNAWGSSTAAADGEVVDTTMA